MLSDYGIENAGLTFLIILNFLGVYICVGENTTKQIFGDWFENGKLLKDDFFKILNLNIDCPEVEIEFQKHEVWRKKTNLRATPTVLISGYQLPKNYKIEDLKYFISCHCGLDPQSPESR